MVEEKVGRVAEGIRERRCADVEYNREHKGLDRGDLDCRWVKPGSNLEKRRGWAIRGSIGGRKSDVA